VLRSPAAGRLPPGPYAACTRSLLGKRWSRRSAPPHDARLQEVDVDGRGLRHVGWPRPPRRVVRFPSAPRWAEDYAMLLGSIYTTLMPPLRHVTGMAVCSLQAPILPREAHADGAWGRELA
jgi:hypothetical protein